MRNKMDFNLFRKICLHYMKIDFCCRKSEFWPYNLIIVMQLSKRSATTLMYKKKIITALLYKFRESLRDHVSFQICFRFASYLFRNSLQISESALAKCFVK